MLLVSIDVEYKNNIIAELRKQDEKIKTNIFILDDINCNFNYDEYDYIITEYDPKKIDYFYALNKNVIICCFDEEEVDSVYQDKTNIYICNNKEDIYKIITRKKKKKNKLTINFKKLVPACLIIIVAFSLFLGLSKLNISSKNIEKKNIKHANVQTRQIDFGKENYVFYGDSITEFYELENYYGDLPVVNSGISGNQTKNLLDDVDKRVLKYNPTKVFILIGTNDIAFTEITNEELVDKIIEICDKIHEEKNKTEIYVQSIYPINKNDEDNDIVDLDMVLRRDNDRIKEINKLLKEKVEDNHYNYIDMYDVLKDEDDNLKLEYTVDGLHISEEGYKVITEVIKKIIYKGVATQN